jgi:manganese oxidase
MNAPLRILALISAAALVAGCAASATPTWTYAPVPPPDAAAPASTQAPAQPAPEQPPADEGEILGQFEIRAFDLGFDPVNITVEQPGRYEFTLINDAALPHDLVFDDGTATPVIDGGETSTIEVYIPAEGIEFICSVPGHADAGMRGSVTVTGTGNGDDNGHGGHQPPPGAEPMTAEEMRDIDAARTAMFPAETEGRGGQLLEPVITDDGYKQWELTASEFEWEIEPGVRVKAMGYNGVVPGPELRAELGDRVRVILHNEMSEPTTIHFHGLHVPNSMDGVALITQPAVMPGESFTYEFEVRNTGSHMYHSHFMAAHQVSKGLLGAFIVNDPDDPPVDIDYVMVLNDGPLGYTLNGKSFPATEPIVAKLGQRIRVRYMNEGFQIHPMHLHGPPQLIVARDGYALAQPYMQDNVLVSPGERVDVIIEATELGVWAFHCHVLTHAEGPQGMFGMVTALIVEE